MAIFFLKTQYELKKQLLAKPNKQVIEKAQIYGNKNKKIRYSIDFGVVPKKFLKMFNKKNHFSSYHSSKKHFIDIDSAN